MRYLLLTFIAVLVVMWLARSKAIPGKTEQARRPSAPQSDEPVEAMVRCAHCGTYIPASESVTAPSGKAFCSEEHRLQHGKA